MSRQATKAVGNRYYEARMRAAKYNEKLLTRAGAIEYLPGVTEDSLKKYELDITRPPNIVVALMADAYNEPELRSWYCVNECPLGKDCREIPEMPAERALIRLQNSVYEMEEVTKQLSLIMEDGAVSAGEWDTLEEIRKKLLEFRRRADENLAVLEKAAKIRRNGYAPHPQEPTRGRRGGAVHQAAEGHELHRHVGPEAGQIKSGDFRGENFRKSPRRETHFFIPSYFPRFIAEKMP